MNKRYTAEQILKYQSDPNIKEITENRFRFTLEYRKKIYDAVCNSLSHSTIAEFLRNDGYGDTVRKYTVVKAIYNSFKKYGQPKNGERSATSKMYHHDKSDDALLLATGRFQESKHGIAFTDDFTVFISRYPLEPIRRIMHQRKAFSHWAKQHYCLY